MIISSEALNKYESKRDSRIGEKYNKLTIKAWVSRKDGYLVECECGECLTVKYYRLVRNVTRSCRKCFVSTSSGRPLLPDNLGAKRAVKTQYRLEAKRRGLPFTLTEEQFNLLITSPCHYCGLPPSTPVSITSSAAHEDFRYTGVDRVDSSQGYSISNCVPCCKHCNFAKLDRPLDEWLGWIQRIYRFQFDKGTFND